ncbi:OmpH family outer membrane protein [Xylanibacter muris]|uniref:OmpH family outer membrane protein n=2 Tax=Xylanibacter muris TaxID=2736290 RepID=A0ABX2AJ05_9BACT|nr:OmpH family outer membrane protein [Xylanibacter muris]NPD91026.1 OmpH family outer membrane protein [Xylanibacter muris]
MKRIIFLFISSICLIASAQENINKSSVSTTDTALYARNDGQYSISKFGFLSYDSALQSMPDYALAQRQTAALRSKYEQETQRVEREFNQKYEQFLEGLRDFPQTILQKRQTELQELLTKNIAFKEESRRLLAKAEQDIFAPLHARLSAVIKEIGTKRGYSFILNTDNNSCPFINPLQGEDINGIVKESLSK